MTRWTGGRSWVGWVLAAYALAAAVILFSPLSPSRLVEAATQVLRDDAGFTVIRQGWVEFAANVALFIPVGLLITLLFRRAWLGVAVAVALSVSAELVQFLLPSRNPSLRDVFANSLGAAIGAGVALVTLIASRRRSERRRGTTRAPRTPEAPPSRPS